MSSRSCLNDTNHLEFFFFTYRNYSRFWMIDVRKSLLFSLLCISFGVRETKFSFSSLLTSLKYPSLPSLIQTDEVDSSVQLRSKVIFTPTGNSNPSFEEMKRPGRLPVSEDTRPVHTIKYHSQLTNTKLKTGNGGVIIYITKKTALDYVNVHKCGIDYRSMLVNDSSEGEWY